MSYTVEIRHSIGINGEGIIPHTFLVITDNAGRQHEYGFAPQTTGLYGTGKISETINHPYDSSTTVNITQTQYNSLIAGINESMKTPPYYALPEGQQCTVWALTQLADANIIPKYLAPILGGDDGGNLAGLMQTIIFNPYVQTSGIGYYNLFNYGVDKIKALGNSLNGGLENIRHWLGVDASDYTDEQLSTAIMMALITDTPLTDSDGNNLVDANGNRWLIAYNGTDVGSLFTINTEDTNGNLLDSNSVFFGDDGTLLGNIKSFDPTTTYIDPNSPEYTTRYANRATVSGLLESFQQNIAHEALMASGIATSAWAYDDSLFGGYVQYVDDELLVA